MKQALFSSIDKSKKIGIVWVTRTIKDSLKRITVKALDISRFPRDSLTLLRTLCIAAFLFLRQ